MAAPKPADDVDDLDSYLDDVLDDFSAPPPPIPISAAAPATEPSFDDDFARQLAADMEQLFKNGGEDTAGNSEINSAMAQFMESFKELQVSPDSSAVANGVATSSVRATASKAPVEPSIPATPKSFQDTVAQTMKKLRTSSNQVEQQVADDAKMASLTGGMSEEAMEQMMKELEGMLGSGDFENVFGGLMEQLMSRELLYEPMKDLASKYPQWLEANQHKLSKEEIEKYTAQHGYVKEIVRIYDASPTPEASEEDQKIVADLMQKMQECGNPPEEILQELAPGLQIGADGMPNLPGGGPGGQDCNIM
ncbi:Pex19 protein [Powellomyces hirtus]|nr:Pex19 protein [Powellomyces hirtus]